MHSSFPRKDEKHMYKPVTKESIRYWINRMKRTCQTNQRVIGVLVVVILLVTILFWGRRKEDVDNHASPVVLVAVLEDRDAAGDDVRILDKILENRWEYANAHGTSLAYGIDSRL